MSNHQPMPEIDLADPRILADPYTEQVEFDRAQAELARLGRVGCLPHIRVLYQRLSRPTEKRHIKAAQPVAAVRPALWEREVVGAWSTTMDKLKRMVGGNSYDDFEDAADADPWLGGGYGQ